MYNLLTLTTLYQFYRQPFVLIFLSTAAGILIADTIEQSWIIPAIALAFALIFFGLEYSGRLKNRLFALLLVPVFLFVGALLQVERSSSLGVQEIKKRYHVGDVYTLVLEEASVGKGKWNRCLARIESLYKDGAFETQNAKVLIFLEKSNYPIVRGDRLLCVSKLEEIRNKNNPGEFNARHYWRTKGIRLIAFASLDDFRIIDRIDLGWFDQFIQSTRDYCSSVLSAHFSGQNEAVLKAIVLGDKSLIDKETSMSFMNTGAMHVLAVSGLHIGLILYLLLFVLERFASFISRKTALFSLLILLWIYAFVTGMSPSVIRAVFMFSMLSLSQLSGRNYEPINILFFTAFVLLLYEPMYIYDIGFQLSYLAMVGIFLFYEKIEAGINVNHWLLKKVWQGTAIGFAAQLMTTPLSLAYFHQFPNYFALANLGMMLFSGLILGFGLGVFTVSFIPFLVKPVVFFLGIILSLTIGFLAWVEKLPGAVAYGYDMQVLQISLIMLGTAFVFFAVKSRYKIILSSCMIIIGVGWVSWDRFEKMNGSELVVFNSNQPLLALKYKSEIHCFYKEKKEGDFDKIQRTMSDYTKVNPGDIVYHKLDTTSYKTKRKGLDFRVESTQSTIDIELNGETFCVQTKNEISPSENHFLIGMPWITKGVDKKLSDGAYIYPLNSSY